MPKHPESGFQLLELSVVLVIIGVLTMAAVPRVERAIETTRVDQSTGTMQSLWMAQRWHRLETGRFARRMDELEKLRLIKTEPLRADAPFRYRFRRVSADGVVIEARRRNSRRWHGRILMDKNGELSGAVSGRGGDRVLP